MNEGETPIYCDCCGQVKLAAIRDGKLIIARKQNRRWHTKSLSLNDFAKLIEDALKNGGLTNRVP